MIRTTFRNCHLRVSTMNNDEERKELMEKVSRLESKVLELERLSNSSNERAEFLQEVLDSVPSMISVWGMDGLMKFVNLAFLKEAGYERDAVMGMSLNELYPPQEIDRVIKMYNQLQHEPDGTSSSIMINGVTADGKWVFIQGTTIKKTSPPIGGFVGYGVNATDQVTAQIDYEDSVEAMGTVFNSVQDGLLIHDKTGSFVQLNQKASEIFGITLSDITLSVPPLTAEKFYSPEDDSFDLRLIWHEILAGHNKQMEYRIKRNKDGRLFDLEVLMCPIKLKGNEYILVSIKDITEKKRVADELHRTVLLAEKLRKRAEAASEAKSKFLANMSHELRTPLTAILGFSELLEGGYYGQLNERQSSYISSIYRSGHHLLQLINDILDIAKVEAGKMAMAPGSINLGLLLENSLTIIKETALRAGIQVGREIDPQLYDQDVWADEVRLKQIVMNLLSNAVKFTPHGGFIKLGACVTDGQIQVKVADSGIGIEPQDQSRIFEEFEQVDSSYSRKHQGTGLGLALSRKLVELHGGSIWVESDGKNRGSVFFFEIPHVISGELKQPGTHLHELKSLDTYRDVESAHENRPCILVVEDNAGNMRVTTNLLEIVGYKTLEAFSSEEAIDILKTHSPSLILMDISLPGMDGLTATQAIKRNPATAHIPIVALTAHAMKDDEVRALEVGCEAYLLKPIDTRVFFKTIGGILDIGNPAGM